MKIAEVAVRNGLRQVLQLIIATLQGTAIGVAAGYTMLISYHCARSWYQGGSADPRCAYGWKGYVEIHQLYHGQPERVSCEYRPHVGAP